MRKISYNYCDQNLLNNPIKYQMSPYSGLEFLNSYENVRKNFLNEINPSSTSVNILDILPNEFFDSVQTDSNSHIIVEDFLRQQLNKILTSEFTLNEDINKLLKKFEIKKQIFSEYDFEFKKNFGDHKNLLNYLLLSIICLYIYEYSKNLKFFNTGLKLNDLLCSQKVSIFTSIEKLLLHYVISKELHLVKKLSQDVGIKL